MARRIAYRGAVYASAFAQEKSGACPAGEFFDGLEAADQAKLMALFQIAGDHGKSSNPQKFGHLGGGLYEFQAVPSPHAVRLRAERARTDCGYARVCEKEGQDAQSRDRAGVADIRRGSRLGQAGGGEESSG